MKITQLDHLVLTVSDIERTMRFYQQVLGMTPVTFAKGRRALAFGNQKINLHPVDAGYEPKADRPLPGSADLCFLLSENLEEAIETLRQHGIEIEEGPVMRTGAQGPIESIYIRDPDANLIELAVLQDNESPL